MSQWRLLAQPLKKLFTWNKSKLWNGLSYFDVRNKSKDYNYVPLHMFFDCMKQYMKQELIYPITHQLNKE